MLRVRPVVSTSDLPRAADLLRALGLVPAASPAPEGSCAVFDAGSGRVALRPCAAGGAGEGSVVLAVDVGDVREFARRTAEAGTSVELLDGDHGLTARVTSPDGVGLLASIGPRGTGAPASPLAVVALRYSPDLAGTVRVLADIGARPRSGPDAGTRQDFRAKNGGLVSVRAGSRAVVGLALEYDGDVRDLLPGLIGGGFEPVVDDGESLRVPAPWGGEVQVVGKQRDTLG